MESKTRGGDIFCSMLKKVSNVLTFNFSDKKSRAAYYQKIDASGDYSYWPRICSKLYCELCAESNTNKQ